MLLLSGERNLSLRGLVVTTSEVVHWVSMVAASPSPTAYLAATLCVAIFGSDEDGA